MKKLVLFVLMLLPMCSSVSAHGQNKAEFREKFLELTDTLTTEEKDSLFSILNSVTLDFIDYNLNEGSYCQALEFIDSIQGNWKYLTGQDVPTQIFFKKALVLVQFGEWEKLKELTGECLSTHKGDIKEPELAVIYNMQGLSHLSLKEYQEAIKSYEHASLYYSKTGDIGGQANVLCNMASCYEKLMNHPMAYSFYEKGMTLFFKYFNTSRSKLLKRELCNSDPQKDATLGVFADHLYDLAVFEQNNGSRDAMRDYLLMSAHCGNPDAQKEYKRIFGD